MLPLKAYRDHLPEAELELARFLVDGTLTLFLGAGASSDWGCLDGEL